MLSREVFKEGKDSRILTPLAVQGFKGAIDPQRCIYSLDIKPKNKESEVTYVTAQPSLDQG